jgi:N-acetyl-beta-hexosaminidase
MTTSAKIQFAGTQVALWIEQNPTATRVAMFVLPVAVALAAALLTGSTVYACPAGSSGSGGCR